MRFPKVLHVAINSEDGTSYFVAAETAIEAIESADDQPVLVARYTLSGQPTRLELRTSVCEPEPGTRTRAKK